MLPDERARRPLERREPPPAEAGAGLDAAPTDADVVVDAGADAAQPFRCEGRAAVFCADFELVPWPAPFNQPSPDTAMAEVIEGAGLSGRGVVTRTPERSVSGRAGPAVVEAQTSMGVKQAFTVSYDVKVDRVIGAGNVLLALFYSYAPFYIATLRVENDGRCFLDEYGDGMATLPSLSF